MEAKALMEHHGEQDRPLPALSRAVGLNEKRLQAGFQALFGRSVQAQLTTIRIEAATRMLSRRTSVTETAFAVGFSILSHFSKVFRDTTGTTPKRWAMCHAHA